MNSGAGPLVMFQVPSPLANATGMDPHPGVCRTKAISLSSVPLTSPVLTHMPVVLDHAPPPMNSGAGPVVMFQVPLPLAIAPGMVPHPGVCRTKAMSVSPLPFYFLNDTATPEIFALSLHATLPVAGPLVMFQVPSPLANATGMDPHPGICRTKAIELSSRPFVTPRPSRRPSELTHGPRTTASGAAPAVVFPVRAR